MPAFPDWKNYVDDTLAMNNMFSFRFWHGQGRIFLDVADGVEGFLLYLNGEPLDTAGITAGTWSVDISGAARNGVNTLQLSGLRYSGEADKAVTVYIPYPEVLPGDAAEEGIRPETLRLISDLIEADISHGFPSAQLAVVRDGRLVYEHSWGFKNSFLPDGTPVVDGDPVTAETMYDLASVTKMFSAVYAVQRLAEQGLLDEVRALLKCGVPRGSTALQAIGYKECLSFLDGQSTEEEALELIKLRSRQYAKRQLTWLRRNQDIHWFYWKKTRDFQAALAFSTEILRQRGVS